MIDTIYNAIPNELFINYMDSLTNRVFKILPMKDDKDKTVDTYISSLLFEMTGEQELIVFLKNDRRYMTVLNKLQGLLSDDSNYRGVIFDCLSDIGVLKQRYCKGRDTNAN